jgi:hypothetical protein
MEINRIQNMLQHLEEDIQTVCTPKQRQLIRYGHFALFSPTLHSAAIEKGTFITEFQDLSQLQPPGYGPTTSNCVYLWREKVVQLYLINCHSCLEKDTLASQLAQDKNVIKNI